MGFSVSTEARTSPNGATRAPLIKPIKNFRFEVAADTNVGLKRKINEDSILGDDIEPVWLVADGMGGHAAGDFASQTIVAAMQTLGVAASWEDLNHRFVHRLRHANTRIYHHAEEQGNGAIGSTIAALLAHEGRFVCCWSGDSRVYRLRGRHLRQITKDHTELQALLDAGHISLEDAENYPRKNVITQAIGVAEDADFDAVEGRLTDGDVFLICSDGLTEYFGDPEIEAILNAHGRDLETACETLIFQAVERGGKDNVSVIVIRAYELSLPFAPIVDGYPEIEGAQ